MNIFKVILKKIVYTSQNFCDYFKKKKIKNEILTYYANNPTKDAEILAALKYINKSNFEQIPYEFKNKYKLNDINVYKNKSNGLYYIIRDNKKLYFCRNMTKKMVRNLYRYLIIEQDIESPHRYLTEIFNVTGKDIFVDIGSAEGILALDVIDKVKKIYLFEYEDAWIEALQYTFAPWKDKVEIIKKYVSDETINQFITVDDFFKEKDECPSFIKIDVEGAEMKVLKGMKQTIDTKENILKLAICTYHHGYDYDEITKFISNRHMTYETSSKYMLFRNKPYFRRGLIRVTKQITDKSIFSM